MMNTPYKMIVGVVSMILGLTLYGFGVVPAEITPLTQVISADVQGLVFYADGQTPAADVPIRIWDIEKREFIYSAQTDENGYFHLPKLEPGKYYVTFDWVKVELLVVEPVGGVQQPHDVVVVIPRGLGFMSLTHLSSLLVASTITESALLSEWNFERPSVVSP